MAFGAATVWEVQPGTGSDTANGGGFDPGATMATDLAATSATGTAPVVTSASYNFVSGDIGSRVFIKSGTNWTPGWYTISGVSSNAATLSAGVGAAVLYQNSQPGSMNTVAGCATTASPTGGTWSVDYSTRGTPIYSYTDMAIDGSNSAKFTSSAHPVGPNIVGNMIAVTSGGGFTVQWVEVISVSGTTATCDKSLGTVGSTGGNGGLGGALATIGEAGALHVASNVIFLHANSPCTCTNSSNVAGGKLTTTGGSNANHTTLCGYLTNRCLTNTDGSRPVVQPAAATNNVTCVVTNAKSTVRNIDFENANAGTGCVAVDTGANGQINVSNCKMAGYKTGFRVAASLGYFTLQNCEIVLANESSALGIDTPGEGTIRGCYIHGGTSASSIGISAANYCSIEDTVIANITGTNGTGITTGVGSKIDNVTLYNMKIGIDMSGGSAGIYVRNCYFEACATDGIKFGALMDSDRAINCAGFNNGADYDSANATPLTVQGFISCSASALTAPGSGDFTLNTAAGGGALLRGAGFPSTYPGLSPTSYPTIGAYSPQAASAGGCPHLAGLGGGLAG